MAISNYRQSGTSLTQKKHAITSLTKLLARNRQSSVTDPVRSIWSISFRSSETGQPRVGFSVAGLKRNEKRVHCGNLYRSEGMETKPSYLDRFVSGGNFSWISVGCLAIRMSLDFARTIQ